MKLGEGEWQCEYTVTAKPSNHRERWKVQVQRTGGITLGWSNLWRPPGGGGIWVWSLGMSGRAIPLLFVDHSVGMLSCLPPPHVYRLQLSSLIWLGGPSLPCPNLRSCSPCPAFYPLLFSSLHLHPFCLSSQQSLEQLGLLIPSILTHSCPVFSVKKKKIINHGNKAINYDSEIPEPSCGNVYYHQQIIP